MCVCVWRIKGNERKRKSRFCKKMNTSLKRLMRVCTEVVTEAAAVGQEASSSVCVALLVVQGKLELIPGDVVDLADDCFWDKMGS